MFGNIFTSGHLELYLVKVLVILYVYTPSHRIGVKKGSYGELNIYKDFTFIYQEDDVQ
jgi:hypothetical protein